MTRDDVLDTAKGLINGSRAEDYGSARLNHARIAQIWSVIFNVDVTPQQVMAAMIGAKLARLANPLRPDMDHPDSWVDVCGYAALGGEITSPTKLEVRPVEERSPPF